MTAVRVSRSVTFPFCYPTFTTQVLIDTGVVPGGSGGSASGVGFNPRKSPDSSSGSGAAAAAAVSEDLIAEFCRFGAGECWVREGRMGEGRGGEGRGGEGTGLEREGGEGVVDTRPK